MCCVGYVTNCKINGDAVYFTTSRCSHNRHCFVEVKTEKIIKLENKVCLQFLCLLSKVSCDSSQNISQVKVKSSQVAYTAMSGTHRQSIQF